MGEHAKKESSHEETYALRRPPKKRSSASKVRMTSSLVDHHVTTSPTFERRMRNVLIRDEQKRKRLNTSRGPANVKLVTSIEDYKKVVGEEREKIVVARFYAPWCKVCALISVILLERRCRHGHRHLLAITFSVSGSHESLSFKV
jgi:hypothetical protein